MAETVLTTEDFLKLLDPFLPSGRDEAIQKGIISSQDLSSVSMPIERKDAARLLHEILLQVQGEPDEGDWSAALDLKDLFDCHVCVQHIAQIYSKGIMERMKDDSGKMIFGSHSGMTREEAECAIERMSCPDRRTCPSRRPVLFQTCTLEECRDAFLKKRGTVIDIRERDLHDRQPLIPGCRNIPLKELWLNPYSASEDRNASIYLFCSKGYQSSLAAELLIQYGYRNLTVVKSV